MALLLETSTQIQTAAAQLIELAERAGVKCEPVSDTGERFVFGEHDHTLALVERPDNTIVAQLEVVFGRNGQPRPLGAVNILDITTLQAAAQSYGFLK